MGGCTAQLSLTKRLSECLSEWERGSTAHGVGSWGTSHAVYRVTGFCGSAVTGPVTADRFSREQPACTGSSVVFAFYSSCLFQVPLSGAAST